MSKGSVAVNRQREGQRREIPRATLSDLLERAAPYERWRAPLDPRLQQLTWLSGAALVAHLLFLGFLPQLLEWTRSGFFLVLGGVLQGIFLWIADHALLLGVLNVVALSVYLALLWRTRGLRTGTLAWQRVAFGEVAAGAAGALPLAVSLGVAALNVGLWIVVIAIGLVIGILSAAAAIALMCWILWGLVEAMFGG